MQEWKELLAVISIIALLSWTGLNLVMFGPLLNDPEFDNALVWAEYTGIQNMERTRNYPFSMITRAEAVGWYIATAQEVGMVPQTTTGCEFSDITELEASVQKEILLACQYGFFKGNDGKFLPDNYLTKAGSLVALVRGFYPGVEFPETEPYREPYVEFAYNRDLTERESSPYMMYLISRYELLLQLYRIYQSKT